MWLQELLEASTILKVVSTSTTHSHANAYGANGRVSNIRASLLSRKKTRKKIPRLIGLKHCTRRHSPLEGARLQSFWETSLSFFFIDHLYYHRHTGDVFIYTHCLHILSTQPLVVLFSLLFHNISVQKFLKQQHLILIIIHSCISCVPLFLSSNKSIQNLVTSTSFENKSICVSTISILHLF